MIYFTPLHFFSFATQPMPTKWVQMSKGVNLQWCKIGDQPKVGVRM